MADNGFSIESSAFMEALGGSKAFLEEAGIVELRLRAGRIADRARALAPEGSGDDPHPGRLKADIGIKGEGVEASGPYIEVGTTEPEGFFQEYGTIDDPPNPFMRPAIAENSK